MIKILFKKSISLTLAFAILLSLSCCGAGDEVLTDEVTTESTSEATETTTSVTTEELTTLETTTEEMTETILASLTDEEKEVWLSMPDIVTMRLLRRYDKEEKEYYSEFIYNEIIYIDKIGQIKKFISYDECTSIDDNDTIKWLNEQISQSKDVEIINVADIHTLIEFYNTLTCIDPNSKLEQWSGAGFAVDIERHYWFEIFGIKNNIGNKLEALCISEGDAGYYSILHNYLRKYDSRKDSYRNENIDTYGSDAFELYLKLDQFIVKGAGGMGHLTGEIG